VNTPNDLSGLAFRKSSASANNGNCVEVAMLPDGGRALRNSKDPNGAVVFYTNAEWTAFLTGSKNGEFDDDYETA
jgi:Domain of unknown function (DUF397)